MPTFALYIRRLPAFPLINHRTYPRTHFPYIFLCYRTSDELIASYLVRSFCYPPSISLCLLSLPTCRNSRSNSDSPCQVFPDHSQISFLPHSFHRFPITHFFNRFLQFFFKSLGSLLTMALTLPLNIPRAISYPHLQNISQVCSGSLPRIYFQASPLRLHSPYLSQCVLTNPHRHLNKRALNSFQLLRSCPSPYFHPVKTCRLHYLVY